MKRKGIFLVSSIIGLGVTAHVVRGGLWHDFPFAPAGKAQTNATPPPTAQVIDFVSRGALDYLDERGFRASSQAFEATDGVMVSLVTERRGSHEAADGALDETLLTASRIVESKPLLNKDGARIGNRAVAYFTAAESAEERPVILRTTSPNFYRLESASLRHLLMLEEKLFY